MHKDLKTGNHPDMSKTVRAKRKNKKVQLLFLSRHPFPAMLQSEMQTEDRKWFSTCFALFMSARIDPTGKTIIVLFLECPRLMISKWKNAKADWGTAEKKCSSSFICGREELSLIMFQDHFAKLAFSGFASLTQVHSELFLWSVKLKLVCFFPLLEFVHQHHYKYESWTAGAGGAGSNCAWAQYEALVLNTEIPPSLQ